MASKHPNLETRDGVYYLRVELSVDGNVLPIRLSLKTRSLGLARAKAGRLMLQIARARRDVMQQVGLSGEERASILRAAARRQRDALQAAEAAAQLGNPGDWSFGFNRSLQSLEVILTEITQNGIPADYGSHDYFMERFVEGRTNLTTDHLLRVRALLDEQTDFPAQILAQASEELRIRNAAQTPENIFIARKALLAGMLRAIGETLEDQRDASAFIRREASDTDLDQLKALLQQLLPATTQAKAPAEPALPAPDNRYTSMTIREAADAYLAENPTLDAGGGDGDRWTAKTRTQFDASIFLASKHFSGPACRIDNGALATFFRLLRQLPSSHHKSPRHAEMSLEEIAAENSGGGLSATTLNRHFRFLAGLFKWLGTKTAVPIVDWSAFTSKSKKAPRDQRDAFNEAELIALFQAPIWTGGQSPARRFVEGGHIWHDAGYWLPILLVYSGARREEIAKLLCQDVDCIDGIWCIRIRDTDAGRVKNVSSSRDIPLADQVVGLGFLEYVGAVRAAGSTLLFPDLDVEGRAKGDVYYKRWWRALERNGFVAAGKTIHAMRHFVATTLADAGVTEERRADLLGHTLTSETAGRYTKRARLQRLQEAVNRIPIVTEHLAPAPINLSFAR